jgi:membrane-associated phospholipid phosphatase
LLHRVSRLLRGHAGRRRVSGFKALNSPANPFGVFFERIGKLPVYLIIPFSAMAFFNTRPRGKNAAAVLIAAATVLYSAAGCIYMCMYLGGNWFVADEYRDAYCVIFGLAVSAATLFISKHLPNETMKKLRPYAWFAMIAGLGTSLSIELIKNIWGRVRFRDLLRAESFDAFTAWWLPQGENGNKSFPSGHTGAASAAILLTGLPCVFESLKKHETRFFIAGALYTFAVGFSRLVVGAHYLSDIAVGALIGFTWYFCARSFYLAKQSTRSC